MRYSIHGIVDATDIMRVSELSGLSEDRCRELIDYLGTHTDVVPGENDDELEALDYALASLPSRLRSPAMRAIWSSSIPRWVSATSRPARI